MKKIIVSMLCMVMAVTAIAGCAKKGVTNMSEAVERGENGKITKEPLELTIHLHTWNSVAFKDDWEVYQKAFDMTNIKLKGTASEISTDSLQEFNLMMAKKELPDIVHGERSNINKYALEGAFVPLDELIEEHAPNIKAFFDANPEIKKLALASDGSLYQIPYVYDGLAAEGWFIRKDWLDKVNLPVPTTVEEYYNALKAFKEMDPNCVPFFNRDGDAGVRDLLPLFGVRELWGINENNEVVYGPYQAEYKDAIKNIKKWFDEGLIDNQIFTRGNNARDILFGENKGGSTHDWFVSTGAFNDKLKETVPGFELAYMLPLKGENGKGFEESSRDAITTNGWAISANNKYPVETIKYFDFFFTEEGRRLSEFGIEGKTYEMVDGKPMLLPEILQAPEGVMNALMKYGAKVEIGVRADISYEKQTMSEVSEKAMSAYEENKVFAKKLPAFALSEEEEEFVVSKLNSIETYAKEMRQRWILGSGDIDAEYDEYISELEKRGVKEVLDIYSRAYEEFLAR